MTLLLHLVSVFLLNLDNLIEQELIKIKDPSCSFVVILEEIGVDFAQYQGNSASSINSIFFVFKLVNQSDSIIYFPKLVSTDASNVKAMASAKNDKKYFEIVNSRDTLQLKLKYQDFSVYPRSTLDINEELENYLFLSKIANNNFKQGLFDYFINCQYDYCIEQTTNIDNIEIKKVIRKKVIISGNLTMVFNHKGLVIDHLSR